MALWKAKLLSGRHFKCKSFCWCLTISFRMDFQVCRRPRKIKLVLSDWVDLKIKLEISNVRFSDSSIGLISNSRQKRFPTVNFRHASGHPAGKFWWATFGQKKVWGSCLFGVSSNEMVSLIEAEEACTKIIWFWVFFVFWHMRSDQRAYRNVDGV